MIAIRRFFVALLVAGALAGLAHADSYYDLELPYNIEVARGSSTDVPLTIRNKTLDSTVPLSLTVSIQDGYHYESLSQPDCGAFSADSANSVTATIAAVPVGTERTCTMRISRDADAASFTATLSMSSHDVPPVSIFMTARIGSFGEVALSASLVSSEVVLADGDLSTLRIVRLTGLNQGSSPVQAAVALGPCVGEQVQSDACVVTPGIGSCGVPGAAAAKAFLPLAGPGSTSSCTIEFATSTTADTVFGAQVDGLTEQDGTFAFDIDDTNSAVALLLPAPSVPTNQYGLSGSWVNPAAASQGIVLSIQPDFYGGGNALLFGGWFTYAPYADQGQRWYTIQAETAGGMQQMPIYRTDGGLFASPMPTTTTQVGTATLRFFDCRYGSLDYSIFDGGGLLQGTMPLTRLLNNVRCGAGGDTGNSTASYQLTGVWADPSNSGQGLVLEVDTIQHVLFGAWYTFAGNAAQAGLRRWYTLQAAIDDNAIQTGPIAIFASKGGRFGGGGAPTTEYVGSGTLIENDCNSATLAYEFTSGENAGLGGTLHLGRLGSAPPECD